MMVGKERQGQAENGGRPCYVRGTAVRNGSTGTHVTETRVALDLISRLDLQWAFVRTTITTDGGEQWDGFLLCSSFRHHNRTDPSTNLHFFFQK